MHKYDRKPLWEQEQSSFCITTIALLKLNKLILPYNKEAVLHLVCQLRISLSQRILGYHIKATVLPNPVCSIFSKVNRQVCSCWRVSLWTGNKMTVVAVEISGHIFCESYLWCLGVTDACESGSVRKNQK